MGAAVQKLPGPGEVKAFLFDIDGTLTHSDPVHFAIFKELLLELGANDGKEIDWEFFHQHISGRENQSIFSGLFPDWTEERIREVSDTKEAKFRALAASKLLPVDGLLSLTAWAKARGLLVAAVTNAPRANAEMMLDAIGLKVDVLIIGAECARAKPHPDPYQAALRAFECEPSQAIAFEDSPTGMRSAVAAGVSTIGVLTSQSAATLQEAGAALVTPDYSAPVLWSYLQP